jgi:integrase
MRAATAEEVGPGFLDDFVSYAAGAGLSNSTVNKLLTRLRGFLTWLYDRGDIERVPKAKRLPTQRNAALYLTAEELARLEALDLDEEPWTEGQRHARDLFLVAASTGQRFGDVVAMEWDHVRGLDDLADSADQDAVELTWYLSTKKAGLVTRVPLVGPARRIVAARHRVGCITPTPRVSNQLANRYLKELGRAADLTEPVTTVKNVGGERRVTTRPKHEALTTHAARRTFVTLVLQSGTAPTELLGLTHSDLRTLQLYVGADEKKRRGQIAGAFGTS